jgi:RNA recognition motif-containing protein
MDDDDDDDDDKNNKIAHLQQAVDSFSVLSSHCPMTPMLWMQYSADTADLLHALSDDEASALTTRLQMLELALAEFPGSAILHVHYLQLLVKTDNDNDDSNDNDNKDKIRTALDTAIQFVGQGSHRNEGDLIAEIYRMDASFRAKHESWDAAIDSFHTRARVPMKDVNQALATEYHHFCATHQNKSPLPEDLEGIELGRRFESKTYNVLVTCEDDVDIAMHSEGILPRHQVDMETLDWTTILRSDDKTFWMGFGGMASSDAFHKYATTCYRYYLPGSRGDSAEEAKDRKEVENTIKSLAPNVYERGIAECPTVESLWLSYIHHLQYLVQDDHSIAPKLSSVVDRSFRNCPYSLVLFQQKLKTSLLMADLGMSILDPDELVKSIQGALEAKFITSPAACLELYLSAVEVLRRRILSILGVAADNKQSYDDTEAVQVNPTASYAEIDSGKHEELQDLCEDIRDLYDATDAYLRKHHSAWTEGRGRVWSERALTESLLLAPLVESHSSGGLDPKAAGEVVRCHEKLTKVHQPCQPDSYATFVKHFVGSFPLSCPISVLSRLRQVRSLYQKGLKSVGRPKKTTTLLDQTLERDYETALRSLCHEYLVFERYFGSDRSIASATKNVQKKLAKAFPDGQAAAAATPPLPLQTQEVVVLQPDSMPVDKEENATTSPKPNDEAIISSDNKKRTREDSVSEPPAKKQKPIDDDDAMEISDTTAAAQSTKEENSNGDNNEAKPLTKPEVHKVKVGSMEYPAHPFTIRVSKLHLKTEDMDLVDTFRTKCGAIVHARIMRDHKQHHEGKLKSKGWGLVQFEERDSVEKALELSEIIGLNEKLIRIERSHMPAVALVPSGMHRVNPKGEGKKSKFNQKRREKFAKTETTTTTAEDSKDTKQDSPKKEPSTTSNSVGTSTTSVLAFRPRGVLHRKVKVAVPKKEE